MNKKVAFVLGGGSIYGIWQMGAINNIIGRGIYPDILTGISVGKHYNNYPNKEVDWNEVNIYLKNFWFENITCPDDIAYKKSAIKLLWELLRGKFNGFSDTKPLRKLINENIQTRNVMRSRIKISSGCVNIEEGKILYTEPSMSNYNQFVLASSSIPFMMPIEQIGQLKYTDGGLIDSAPIGQAIKMGATEIIVFANHPEKVGHRAINHNNPLAFADRLMEIIVNNTLNNDIMEAQLINELLSDGVKCERTKNKKVIDIKVIRPKTRIDLKIDKFTKEDIKYTWQMGWNESECLKFQ